METSDLTIIPTGTPCWGCVDLEKIEIKFVGEDFKCKRYDVVLGRIRKLNEGIIVPREVLSGCYS